MRKTPFAFRAKGIVEPARLSRDIWKSVSNKNHA